MRKTMGVGLVLGLTGLVIAVGPAVSQDRQPAAAPAESAAARAAAIAAKLARPVKIDKQENVPLRDVLEFLGDQVGVTFLVNDQALSGGGPGMAVANAAAGAPEDYRVHVPKLANVRLSRVLDLIARQVNGAWLVRPDCVEITSVGERQRAGVFRTDPSNADAADVDQTRTDVPLVNLSVKGRPLADVLAGLASLYERSVIVSPQSGDKARAPVSAEFLNVPFDTAVLMLADMADLKVVPRDNALYVTTAERVAQWTKELQEQQMRMWQLQGGQNLGGGLGVGGLGAGPVGGAAGVGSALNEEVVKLKQEVEELRKQIKDRGAEPKKP
jgi:hypothetical protein